MHNETFELLLSLIYIIYHISYDVNNAKIRIHNDSFNGFKFDFPVPSELYGKTYDEIADLAKPGEGAEKDAAQTAKKLLDSNEYDKDENR
jgi:hypothetical protein